MHIYNIQEADLSAGEFQRLSFSDANATAAEIEAALNKVKKCNHLSIYSGTLSEMTGSLQHIEGLNSVSLNLAHLSTLPDDFFPESLTHCYLMAERLVKLPSSIFLNHQLTNLNLRVAAVSLPNIVLPNLISLNLNMPNLKHLPPKLLTENLNEIIVRSQVMTELPSALSDCLMVKRLHIQSPLQTGFPDLSRLTALNNLTLTNLKEISFSSKMRFPDSLSVVFMHSEMLVKDRFDFAHLKNLSNLNLSSFAHLPEGLVNCTNLKNITLNRITTSPLPDLSTCQNVEYFSISNAGLSVFPEFIFNLPRLKSVRIDKTKIRDMPVTFPKNNCIEHLDLRNNQMPITDFSFTEQLTKLKTLNLDGNILIDRYALISNKKIPLIDQHRLLSSVRYQTGKSRYAKKKEPDFLDFCAALGRTKLSLMDKKWFFDLIVNRTNLSQLPDLDFSQFLKALNINFKPLRSLLERKLIRDVLIQHLSETAFFQNPMTFATPPNLKKGDCLLLVGKMTTPKSEIKEIAENLGILTTFRLSEKVTHVVLGQNAEDWKADNDAINFEIITERGLQAYFKKMSPKFLIEEEQSGDLSMVKNMVELLGNEEDQNILLALELMTGGGVPKMVLEDLLLRAKTAPNAEIRKKSKALLITNAPQKWLPLVKNRLEFHQEDLWFSFKEMRKKMLNLSSQIEPELTAFFIVLLQQQLAIYPEMRDELEEFLYEISKSMEGEQYLLEPGAVVFVNGTTRLKKTEIKEKLEAADLKYAQKYSEKVTHVLIGNNPKIWDLDNTKFKVLTENHLQTYLSKITPAYLEQAAEEGDAQMTDNLLSMLHSPDEANVAIALEMMDSGGVPEDLLVPVLVANKSASDAKVRAKARKLLELYAPADWLPLIKSKLLFKGITANAKENDLNKKLDKLAKETSFEVAAILSMGLFEKYGRGLRFMMKKSNRKQYLDAVGLLLDGTHFAFAKGLGFKNWRDHAPEAVILMGTMKTGINFPDSILQLGKIESIDFHNCKLSAMPKSITKFTDVKELDFSHNFIKTLPQGIHNLEKLEVLNLKMNHFDAFPERLAQLKNLEKVDLSFNRMNHQFHKITVPESVKMALPNCEFIL